jgi:Na+/H+ antiporter NhaD/arsenite permease-like protein
VVALGRLPGFRVDRTGAAIIGGTLMIACNVLTVQEAYAAIDYDSIILLFGMMIVVANLRLSGFFTLVSERVLEHAHRPLVLLSAITLVAGAFSAFFVNDTMCLVLTPLVLEVTTRLRRNPVPYLLAVAMASNVGSTATITGNPQNIMIGSFSQIPYTTFAGALWPVAAAGLVLVIILIALYFPAEFWTRERLQGEPQSARVHQPLLIKSLLVVLVMVAAYFAGQTPAKVALIAGSILLVTRRVKSEKVYRQIDWPLLLMFMGLFIVVAGFEKAVLTPDAMSFVSGLHLDQMPVLSLITATLSNLVSNVPAVLVLKPFVAGLPDPQQAWLTIAMSSTLAGNLTLVGSVANLIVAQVARAHGVTIRFWDYAKVGAPLTVLTIMIGIAWLRAG